MNKTRKIWIVAAMTVVVLLAAVGVWLWTPAAYGGLLSWVMRESTGYELDIEDLETGMLPVRLSGSNLRLTNPHAGFDEPLVTVSQFAFVADLGAWWADAPTWWSADASGVVVRVARDEAGAQNWDRPFRDAGETSSGGPEGSAAFQFGSIDIEQLEFRRIEPGETRVFTARRLSLSRDADERLSVELDGSYQGEAVTASGTLPLPTSDRARDVDFTARFPGGSIEVDGRVGHDGLVPGAVEFSFEAENLSAVGRMFDQDLETFDPVAIDGRVEAPEPDLWRLAAEGRLAERPLELTMTLRTPDQRYVVEDLRVDYGGQAVRGSGDIDLTARSATMRIETAAVDVDRLLEWAANGDDDAAADDPWPVPAGWTVQTGISAEKLIYRDYQFRDLNGEVVVEAKGQPDDLTLDAKVSMPGIEANLDATLSPDAYLFESGELQVRVEDLAAIEGLHLPPVWSRTLLPLDGRVVGQLEPSTWRLDPIRIDTPEAVFTGLLTIDHSGRLPHVSGRLHADELDINKWRVTAGMQNPQPDHTREGDAGDGNGDVFSEAPLDWRWLEAITLDLDIALDRLTVNQTLFDNVALRTVMSDARLVVDPLTANLSEGGVRGNAAVTGGGETPEVALELIVTRLAPADLGVRDAGLIDGGYTDLLINLRGRGESPQALASSLVGEVALEVQRATIRNDMFDAIGSDLFAQFFTAINPFAKQEKHTSLECAAAYLQAEDGVLKSTDRIVIETAKMKVRASAVIDLRSERVRVDFRPSARQGLGIGLGDVSGVVRIGGTLGSPHVETDASGVAKAGATIGAAFATGGLSLLAQGIFDRVRNAGGTACGRIFERATDTPIPEAIQTEELESAADSG